MVCSVFLHLQSGPSLSSALGWCFVCIVDLLVFRKKADMELMKIEENNEAHLLSNYTEVRGDGVNYETADSYQCCKSAHLTTLGLNE